MNERNEKDMRCGEFSAISRDYAHREWMSDGVREQAKLHVQSCERCRQLVESEVALSTSLFEYRSGYRRQNAPASMELALMSAFRQQARRNNARRLLWAAPIAAALLLAAAIAVRSTGRTPSSPVAKRILVPVEVPVAAAPPLEAPVEKELIEKGTVDLKAAVPHARRRLRAAPAIAREEVTDFVPLHYGKAVEPGEPLQVVRIQLPRAELARLGLPVAPGGARAMIKADVALGDDGLVKAIRFVY
jgi:hypothetical protein